MCKYVILMIVDTVRVTLILADPYKSTQRQVEFARSWDPMKRLAVGIPHPDYTWSGKGVPGYLRHVRTDRKSGQTYRVNRKLIGKLMDKIMGKSSIHVEWKSDIKL